MRSGPMRQAIVLALVAAFGAPTGAQTIEERAEQVRQLIGKPPPAVETVIDRGTRVIGQPIALPAVPPAVETAIDRGSRVIGQPITLPTAIDRRLIDDAAAAALEAMRSMNPPALGSPAFIGTATPRGTAFVNDPRGTGFLNDTRGTGLQDAMGGVRHAIPGLTVIRPAGGGTVRGAANLVTGGGRLAGFPE